MTSDRAPPKMDYEAWTEEALTNPGKIHAAYSAFHEYSFGNQLLAMMQLEKPEPIASYNHWKTVGRQVSKGAKGIALMMPVSKKVEKDNGEEGHSQFFIMRRYWFPLSATEGAEYIPPSLQEFSIPRAAEQLGIKIEDYQSVNGNAQGYAKTDEKTIAINPLAYDRLKTFIHEAAHVLLHPRSLELGKQQKECEAEISAYLVSCALGHTENLEYSRGYIRHYMSNDALPKIRFGEVYKTVDMILKAGKEQPEIEPSRPAETFERPPQRLSA